MRKTTISGERQLCSVVVSEPALEVASQGAFLAKKDGVPNSPLAVY